MVVTPSGCIYLHSMCVVCVCGVRCIIACAEIRPVDTQTEKLLNRMTFKAILMPKRTTTQLYCVCFVLQGELQVK